MRYSPGFLLVVFLVAGCATSSSQGRSCNFSKKLPSYQPPISWHLFDVSFLSQVTRSLSPIRVCRNALSIPASSNMENGSIADDSFFINRDISRLSADEVRWGPTKENDLIKPPLEIKKLKDEGKTGGFFVIDSEGRKYLLKLDHAEYPELITGAEVVASKLIHAIGYYVPSYEIAYLSESDLRLDPKADLSKEKLDAMLSGRIKDGKIRFCASRIIDGEVLGRVSFKKHRCCAELRALRLVYAWLNNSDSKDHNSLMVWDGSRSIGYLIDFGTSLGADAQRGTKRPCQGWVYDFDIGNFFAEFFTLGFHSSGCDPDQRAWSKAVGIYPSDFNPKGWKPYAPNLAFQDMTAEDARWMALRLKEFSREQLSAAVSAGSYSNIEDSEKIIEILDLRRKAIIKEYLD